MQIPKHIPQLDVLRGIAVLMVMFYHAAVVGPSLHFAPYVSMGYIGVDLFFVLSGFLITGILVRSKHQPHYFKNFFARRALRIWPVYYAVLLFTFVVLPILAPQLKHSIFALARPWQAYPFFIQNLLGNSQRAFDTVRVTWSLAIEEQFYLAWPVIVWLAPRRSLKALAFGALIVSPFLRWAVMDGLISPINITTNTITRLDGLAFGALLALWIPQAGSLLVKYTGLAGLLAVLPAAAFGGWLHPSHWAFYSAVAACFAAALCVAISLPSLSYLTVLRQTGKISYCLYLVHVPVFQFAAWTRRFLPTNPSALVDVALLIASFAVCYGLAAISWKYFESRILQLKSRFENAGDTPGAAPATPAPMPKHDEIHERELVP
jgi:peptidoglycan/LPS O-acetylase OafA/YrhL